MYVDNRHYEPRASHNDYDVLDDSSKPKEASLEKEARQLGMDVDSLEFALRNVKKPRFGDQRENIRRSCISLIASNFLFWVLVIFAPINTLIVLIEIGLLLNVIWRCAKIPFLLLDSRPLVQGRLHQLEDIPSRRISMNTLWIVTLSWIACALLFWSEASVFIAIGVWYLLCEIGMTSERVDEVKCHSCTKSKATFVLEPLTSCEHCLGKGKMRVSEPGELLSLKTCDCSRMLCGDCAGIASN